MTYTPSIIDLVAAAAAIFVVKRLLAPPKPALPLPPGPSGLPLIGNVLDIPQSEPHKTYMQWGHKYGTSTHSVHVQPHLKQSRSDYAHICARTAARHRQ